MTNAATTPITHRTIWASPNWCSSTPKVAMYIAYSAIAAIESLIGAKCAFASILLSSAPASTRLIILPATFAIMNPVRSISSTMATFV